jgi:hypothetical protein
MGLILRNAAGELEDMGAVVLSLERLVCDLVCREPSLAAAEGRELQAFDLLAQRLRGLSGCLAVLAGTLEEDCVEPSVADLVRALPLASQRAVLLGGAQPEIAAGSSLELF